MTGGGVESVTNQRLVRFPLSSSPTNNISLIPRCQFHITELNVIETWVTFSLKMMRYSSVFECKLYVFPNFVSLLGLSFPCSLILFCPFNVQVELSYCSRSSSNSKFFVCLGSYSVWRCWKKSWPRFVIFIVSFKVLKGNWSLKFPVYIWKY